MRPRFITWRADFDWQTPEGHVPLRTIEAGRQYIEAWERFTGLPYFIAPMPMGVLITEPRSEA